MTEQLLISAHHLSVTRDRQSILQDVSLTVNEQDFITIIGPNGAGKSMLLKCLLGLEAPDIGRVERKTKLRIGYVPQRMGVDHSIPIHAYDFLKLGKQVERNEIEHIASETGILHLLHKPMYVLSGGETQRTMLARSLLSAPELLVLDEPAQNLDISGQLSFYKLLDHIYKTRKLSILMVSHDLHLVMSSTKQVVCLFHHICCSGEPHAVTQDPKFISLFGDDMARMMATYHHEHTHSHTHQHNEECSHG